MPDKTLKYYYDYKAPTFTIYNYMSGDTIKNYYDAFNTSQQRDTIIFTLLGTIQDSAYSSGIEAFSINGNTLNTSSNGQFEYPLLLTRGKNYTIPFYIDIKDRAGNESLYNNLIVMIRGIIVCGNDTLSCNPDSGNCGCILP